MTTNAIYEEHGSDWSQQVFAVGTTQWLQRDQTLPLPMKGVACETSLPPPPILNFFQNNKTIRLWADNHDQGLKTRNPPPPPLNPSS